jgi:transcriptional regulator with XRE-family HTH domain
MEDLNLTIAENIHDARIAAGFSQRELGRLVGVTRNRVSDWEAARHTPLPIHLAAIAEHTGRTIGWFFDPHDNEGEAA